MWDFIVEMGSPMVVPFLLTGFLYYTFEVVEPYAAAQREYERLCIEKNGMVYEEKNKPKLCIKKEIIKIE